MISKYKSLDNLFISIGEKYQVSPIVVNKVYESVFSFIKKTIKELPEIKELSVEEMKALKSNFYISKFARFFIDTGRIKIKRNLKVKKYRKIKKNDYIKKS